MIYNYLTLFYSDRFEFTGLNIPIRHHLYLPQKKDIIYMFLIKYFFEKWFAISFSKLGRQYMISTEVRRKYITIHYIQSYIPNVTLYSKSNMT